MGIKRFEEYFESKVNVSLKSINPIIHAMREGNVEEAIGLIKNFSPASGLFIRDEYLVDLASNFNQMEIFNLLFKIKKELKNEN